MELSQAFGNFFREEAPVVEVKKTEPVQKPAPVQKPVSEPVQKTESRRDLGMRYLGSQQGFIDPQFYMINIQIERDDCHLICVFLAVLILSMLLTKK